MATITTPESAIETDADQCVVFPDVGWKGYARLLKLRDERRQPRMVYRDGTLYLMSPAFPHESLKVRLDRLIAEVVVGLDVPCTASGSTTFRRKAKKGGVEGDLTFYLANEAKIRNKTVLDLRVDPPPDLAVEVVWTHDADAAIEVYRRFRVPEVWVCGQDELKILVLQEHRRYAEAERSTVLPMLSIADISRWVHMPWSMPLTEWTKEIRRWVAKVLAPRLQEQKTPAPAATDQIDGPESVN